MHFLPSLILFVQELIEVCALFQAKALFCIGLGYTIKWTEVNKVISSLATSPPARDG